eukprot:CAMPEP_0185019788 /NCGR_PEP_ID=MMETSP1103-20130426/2370_1 /TAXON_ID=36769 /ORGANISM="Paraphysomonas bandaiensis, Strain Caron Lab Isolate" /LENGTH=118 /DNA_ID=CAMNT_0027550269 /DNA_START=53 /DNA_END=409 /DNA_ORIENTATION=-
MAFVGEEKDEFVTSLATMALFDGGADITADQISTLIAATNNTVQPYWPSMFAATLANDCGKIIFARGGGAAPAPVAAAAAAADAGDAAEAAPAAKPVEEEVDALEGGMDMFGGGGSDY